LWWRQWTKRNDGDDEDSNDDDEELQGNNCQLGDWQEAPRPDDLDMTSSPAERKRRKLQEARQCILPLLLYSFDESTSVDINLLTTGPVCYCVIDQKCWFATLLFFLTPLAFRYIKACLLVIFYRGGKSTKKKADKNERAARITYRSQYKEFRVQNENPRGNGADEAHLLTRNHGSTSHTRLVLLLSFPHSPIIIHQTKNGQHV
jgi:hypothetical protein